MAELSSLKNIGKEIERKLKTMGGSIPAFLLIN